MDAIHFLHPSAWCRYQIPAILNDLVEAKASVMALINTPYQKRWADQLQEMQLKLEVAGTSRIEGADFSGNELEQAMKESPEQLLTRSQRQAHAAVSTYRWIATLKPDRPIDLKLLLDIHRGIVTGADDDHCPPGVLRTQDQNVIFGVPPHRGVSGGSECEKAIQDLVNAINGPFQEHDSLIQALMAHYYIAAMHPFLDGNGRTARAIEALMLQRSGLRDTLFIAMSNYYYDEKNRYLTTLAAVRAKGGDLTEFLVFGLRGIAIQTKRLGAVLRENISKELYRNLLHEFYPRLVNGRKRVLGERHIILAEYLLKNGTTEFFALLNALEIPYKGVANPRKALVRDVGYLQGLGALRVSLRSEPDKPRGYNIEALLDWPSKMTQSDFFETVQKMPKTKADSFLSPS